MSSCHCQIRHIEFKSSALRFVLPVIKQMTSLANMANLPIARVKKYPLNNFPNLQTKQARICDLQSYVNNYEQISVNCMFITQKWKSDRESLFYNTGSRILPLCYDLNPHYLKQKLHSLT